MRSRAWRRWREQPGSQEVCCAVHARTVVGGGRIFRRTASATPAIAIKTIVDHPGYLWSFPSTRSHLAIGICAPQPRGESTSPDLRAAVAQRGSIVSYPISRHQTHTLCVADSKRSASTTAMRHDLLRARMDAAGRRRGPGRSADTRGHLLRLLSGQWAADALIAAPMDAPRPAMPNGSGPKCSRNSRAPRGLTGLFFEPEVFSACWLTRSDRARRFEMFSWIWSPAFNPTRA